MGNLTDEIYKDAQESVSNTECTCGGAKPVLDPELASALIRSGLDDCDPRCARCLSEELIKAIDNFNEYRRTKGGH